MAAGIGASSSAVGPEILRASLILAALVLPTVARGEPTFQPNIDMKGFDYANFDLPRPSARLC